ncbi:MAG TPA: hypothetical protein VJI46_04720 [Candidatus Nanoarchaeia archaeon]|nr:hypothetical protein [Candidatus Nanoarchaeia archaeon]
MSCPCHNPYSSGHEVLMKTSTYNVDSHGDYGATLRFLTNEDLPRYTAMFYSLSQHESLAEIRYGRVNADYDEGLNALRQSLQGPPLEVYIPPPTEMPSLPSVRSRETKAQNEIENALHQIKEALLVEEVIEQIIIKKTKKRRILIRR